MNRGSHAGIRVGKWKLVRFGKGPWDLYDMTVSRTETNDLAAGMPEKVAELEEAYHAWEAHCRAAPASR